MRQFEDGGEGDDPWDVEAGKVKKKKQQQKPKKTKQTDSPLKPPESTQLSQHLNFIYLFIYLH